MSLQVAIVQGIGFLCLEIVRPVLTGLFPLLHQSLNCYHLLREMSVEGRVGSEVRLIELDTRL